MLRLASFSSSRSIVALALCATLVPLAAVGCGVGDTPPDEDAGADDAGGGIDAARIDASGPDDDAGELDGGALDGSGDDEDAATDDAGGDLDASAGDGGDPCTTDDECPTSSDLCAPMVCDAGRCVVDAVLCDDGDPCTGDLCDPATGDCSAPALADGASCGSGLCCDGDCVSSTTDDLHCGGCGIVCGANAGCSAGSCECDVDFDDCDVAPGCESSSRTDASNCGGCGITCSGATPACLDGVCGACVDASQCGDDGLSCTSAPTCTAGACVHPLSAGTCRIGGGCFATGDPDPANGCMSCAPTASTTAFTARVGATCDDGAFCTQTDVCGATGTCAGVARSCDDGLSCTTDTCNEAAARCDRTTSPGTCAIAGACYAGGAANPANTACEACDPATPTVWTASEGAPCEDGSFCTVADACSAAGVCAGLPRDCSDPLSCTVDSCDAALGACLHPLGAGCLIGGACYANGAANPADPCFGCDSGVSTSTWTVRPGAVCNDGLFCTSAEVCDAVGACTGMARVCDDTLSCTVDACNEVTRACEATPASDACVIGGACVANGVVDPTNSCRACIPAVSRTGWSPRTGQACDDGLHCTDTDACDATGACTGPARSCTDGNDCTGDTCNETTNMCEHSLGAGTCVIASTCYPGGAPNPANQCQECDPATSPMAWTVRNGDACDDGQFCTLSDQCTGSATCVGTPNPCTDGVACTSDVCDEGGNVCQSPVQAGFCLVTGTCRTSGTINPANPCSSCDPVASSTAWSPRTGARCVDGSVPGCGACTASSTCTTSTTCSDGRSCTSDSCDDLTGGCTAPVNPGSCLIGSACYASGAVNPATPCQQCDPAMSTTAWSPRAGVRCNDGVTDGCGTCNGSGFCATSSTCTDGIACTNDTCADTTGACTYPIAPGSCSIGGACYTAMTVHSGNPCLWCDPAASTTAWSPRTGATCDDSSAAGCGQCNGAGTCATASTCTDALACTANSCTDATGSCVTTTNAGSCLISGACYADGTINPARECQSCQASVSQAAWSARPTTTHCTEPGAATCGICNASANCVVGTTCNDARTCTTDTCTESTWACSATVTSGNCLVAGTCYANGAINPSQSCQYCQYTSNPTDWSSRPSGTVCDDGVVSTCRSCSAGACTMLRMDCNDSLTCTSPDTCVEATATCTNPVSSGGCAIGGACYVSGAINPGNNCQECRPATSTTSWSARTMVTYYRDADSDTYGSPTVTMSACSMPAGYVTNNTDCNDTTSTISPGAAELCNRIDNNCSSGGGTDTTEDADNDGHAPTSHACSGGLPKNDCRDTVATTYTGAPELCDRIDNNCSGGDISAGGTDSAEDVDNDMFSPIGGACSGGPFPETDCVDRHASVHPGVITYFTSPAAYCTAGTLCTSIMSGCAVTQQRCNTGPIGSTCDCTDAAATLTWDYNCAGGNELEPVPARSCSCSAGPAFCGTPGWVTTAPAATCGASYSRGTCGSAASCGACPITPPAPASAFRGCR